MIWGHQNINRAVASHHNAHMLLAHGTPFQSLELPKNSLLLLRLTWLTEALATGGAVPILNMAVFMVNPQAMSPEILRRSPADLWKVALFLAILVSQLSDGDAT